jgi:hypothetical protein
VSIINIINQPVLLITDEDLLMSAIFLKYIHLPSSRCFNYSSDGPSSFVATNLSPELFKEFLLSIPPKLRYKYKDINIPNLQTAIKELKGE